MVDQFGMIGTGAAMSQLRERIRRLAPKAKRCLISGPTGSGKELAARAFHKTSPRHGRRFVSVNCAAVVQTLFESELFGHVRGAFTGAVESRPGLFEHADGGTLFLDEIGELPTALQAKFLRILDSGEFLRVGAVEPRTVDVHVIAATNRDLREDCRTGRFRADLLYRLAVAELTVPALSDRREDIPELARAFLGYGVREIDGPTMTRLVNAPWPGNVRELKNVIERACLLTDGPILRGVELDQIALADEPLAGKGDLVAAQRDHVSKVLSRCRGDKSKAAIMLGVSRRALYRLLVECGLDGTIRRRA